jgi:hypothetical protein
MNIIQYSHYSPSACKNNLKTKKVESKLKLKPFNFIENNQYNRKYLSPYNPNINIAYNGPIKNLKAIKLRKDL